MLWDGKYVSISRGCGCSYCCHYDLCFGMVSMSVSVGGVVVLIAAIMTCALGW